MKKLDVKFDVSDRVYVLHANKIFYCIVDKVTVDETDFNIEWYKYD